MAALQRNPADSIPTTEIFGPSVEPILSDDPIKSLTGIRIPKISYGLPFDKAIVNHVSINARAYIIASRSLANHSDRLERLKKALGDRIKGIRVGMTPHSMFQECLEIIAEAKEVQADTVITLGGGSLADSAKLLCRALVNDINCIEDLEKHKAKVVDGKVILPEAKWPTANLIFIPTTLSAGEHTPFSGISDQATGQKHGVISAQANVTILDPWLGMQTPELVWLQSGVRGIDHCVESTMSKDATPEILKLTVKGLRLLVEGLLECKNDKSSTNVAARLNCQIGAALAIIPVNAGVSGGASHGIGHMMGPMGVNHGETSCILLPSVCKYNASVTQVQQKLLSKTLWEIPACKAVFDTKGFVEHTTDLGDLLDQIIRTLGMPRTLREKGIVGDKKQALARMSLKDPWLATNPIPVKTEEQVLEILNMCEG